MSKPTDMQAAGILAAGCYYCGEAINLREGWVAVGVLDHAHPECARVADEERSEIDHEAMKEQGD